MIRQFGFPQIARGGDGGGGGGGGEEGDPMDAYASVSEPFGLTSDNFSDPDNLGAEAYEAQDFGYGLDQAIDPGNLDFSHSFGQPGYGFDVSMGLDQSTPGFADVWSGLGVGHNNNPGQSNPNGPPDWQGPNQTAQVADPFGFGPRGTFEPDLSWATTPPMSFHERGAPFASRFGALGQPVSDWSNTPSYRGPTNPWAPGPAVAAITVNPSFSNPGTYEQSLPGQATPTAAQTYGLPSATHPGASPQELDWNAIAQSGISQMFSNRAGFVSPEAIAADQARSIPQQTTMANGEQQWMTDRSGFVDPSAMEYNAAQSRPYQISPGQWFSDTQGWLSADNPDVLALLRRG
jgi:hypothetical protein